MKSSLWNIFEWFQSDLDILRQRTNNVEVKKYCIGLLEKLGSFQYTRNVLQTLHEQAREEVERLGGNPHMDNLLTRLLSWKYSPTNLNKFSSHISKWMHANLHCYRIQNCIFTHANGIKTNHREMLIIFELLLCGNYTINKFLLL